MLFSWPRMLPLGRAHSCWGQEGSCKKIRSYLSLSPFLCTTSGRRWPSLPWSAKTSSRGSRWDTSWEEMSESTPMFTNIYPGSRASLKKNDTLLLLLHPTGFVIDSTSHYFPQTQNKLSKWKYIIPVACVSLVVSLLISHQDVKNQEQNMKWALITLY